MMLALGSPDKEDLIRREMDREEENRSGPVSLALRSVPEGDEEIEVARVRAPCLPSAQSR